MYHSVDLFMPSFFLSSDVMLAKMSRTSFLSFRPILIRGMSNFSSFLSSTWLANF